MRLGAAFVCALLALAVAAADGSATVSYFKQAGCPVEFRSERLKQIHGKNIHEVRRAIKRSLFRIGPRKVVRVTRGHDWRSGNPTLRKRVNRLDFLGLLGSAADNKVRRRNVGLSDGLRRRALRKLVSISAGWAHAANRGNIPSGEARKPRTTALRAPILAYAGRAGACRGVLSDGDASELRRALARDNRTLRAPPAVSEPRNHRMSLMVARILVGQYVRNDRRARSMASGAGKRLRKQLLRGYQRQEGTWLEHSPQYHRLALAIVRDYVRNVAPGDRTARSAALNLRRTLGWLVQPDDSLVQWGSTGGRRYGSPYVVESPGRYRGWQPALRSGFVTYSDRAGNWFGLTSQYHFRQHKHHDEGSFDLIHQGRRIVQDTGRWGPGRYRRYERNAKAHSTLIVGNRPFDTELHRKPYGSSVEAVGGGRGWMAVKSRNPLLIAPNKINKRQARNRPPKVKRRLHERIRRAGRRDTTHHRTVLYQPGRALVVLDRVRARRRPHVFQRFLQLAPGVEYHAGALHAGPHRLPLTSRLANGQPQAPQIHRNALFFPDQGTRRKRERLTFLSGGVEVDHALVIGLDGRTASAHVVGGEIGQDWTSLVLRDERGFITDRLTIGRSGRGLVVH